MNGLGEASATGQTLEHNSLPFVRALFNDTAPYYDTVHQIFSLGSGNWYRRRCLTRAGLKPGQKLLDIAIGTGLIAASARSILGAEGDVIGLDLSEAMLAEARRKLDIPLIQGTADNLPIGDACLDFLVMGYAIRHVADLGICLREFRRVLKPGGTVLLLEVSSPTNAIYRATLAYYLRRAVPVLSRWATRQTKVRTLMDYHWETMETCLAPAVILESLTAAGFSDLVCETWFDLFRSYACRKPAV